MLRDWIDFLRTVLTCFQELNSKVSTMSENNVPRISAQWLYTRIHCINDYIVQSIKKRELSYK